MGCRYGTFNNCPGHQEGIRRTVLARRAEESDFAGVAQLVEHLICNQRVRGSNPFASSRIVSGNKQGKHKVGGGTAGLPKNALHKEFSEVK